MTKSFFNTLIILLVFNLTSYSQVITISGIVTDTLHNPLEAVNVIAKPETAGANVLFSITNKSGYYKLELKKDVSYDILVSNLGYLDQTFLVRKEANDLIHDFRLKMVAEQLKEVIINYQTAPVVVKKDTIVFDTKSFASGNERKLKELLEKLPGIEVDKAGNVIFQGRRITKFLVENKLFFGGGSKLAIENIPADALDKVEVLDNYNNVAFMKSLSDSEDIAMNIKLKEEKKKFVFGDIDLQGGDKKHYLAHLALFYYSPKSTLNVINDFNDIGQSSFTAQDVMRFTEGSDYLKRKSQTSLYSFAVPNMDYVKTRSQFAAFNLNEQVHDKLNISGFGLFSKSYNATNVSSEIQYLQNHDFILDKKKQLGDNNSISGIGNLKLDYGSSTKEKLFYNLNYIISNNEGKTSLNSEIQDNQTNFNTLQKVDNMSIEQYLEWHKSHNKYHTTTLVLSHSFNNQEPQNTWISEAKLFPEILPLQQANDYSIGQLKKLKKNFLEGMLKHYWILNDYNHLYTAVGFKHDYSKYITNEFQNVAQGNVYDLTVDTPFGNNLKYQLNDVYGGVEYKFKLGKLIGRPGVYLHAYSLNTIQESGDVKFSTNLLEPQLQLDYNFNDAQKLFFKYNLDNIFGMPEQLADQYTLQNYNTVFKGNRFLKNERYHHSLLRYTCFLFTKGLIFNSTASLDKKVKTIRDIVEIEQIQSGQNTLINQYTTPQLSSNPETNWMVNSSIEQRVWNFKLRFNASLSWFSYVQSMNNIFTKNTQNSQDISLGIRTVNKKWPVISLSYNKRYSTFGGITSSKMVSDIFECDYEISLHKNIIWTGNFLFLKNSNEGMISDYQILNTFLRYQKKTSPWILDLKLNNLFNNFRKSSTSFSDYSISNQTIYTLPRIFLLGVSYKI